MAECIECGKPVVTGEPFCSNCGTKHPLASNELNEVKKSQESQDFSRESTGAAAAGSAASPATESPDLPNPAAESSEGSVVSEESSGGGSTGELRVQVKHTIKKGNTGGQQATVKQLDPGNVLNARYEIVRRIGGGGMGAVYLAKDRNLGGRPARGEGDGRSASRSGLARKSDWRLQAGIFAAYIARTSVDPYHLRLFL